MIESKVRRRLPLAAILARETVAEKNVESGESRMARRRNEFLERNNARQLHIESGGMNGAVVFGENIDAIKKDSLDGILPAPK